MSHRARTPLALVFTIVCIDLLGFGLVLPLLPIYGRELTAGYTKDEAAWILGLLMVSFSLMQFLFAPLWGRLSDRIGRRPVLLLSLAGSAVFYACFGIATLWHSLAGMFLARIGAGIAAATIPTAQAYIADVTPLDKRTRGMALIGAAFGLGFTLGPLIGAGAIFLSRDTGLSPWPGYAASLLSALALVVAIFKLPESVREEAATVSHRRFNLASLREALSIPSIGLLLGSVFFGVFSLASFEGTISLAIKSKLASGPLDPQADWTLQTRLMLVFAYIGIIQCLVQGILVRRLANYVSEAVLGTWGLGLSILGFALLALVARAPEDAVGALMLAAAVEVSGIALVFPAIQSLISRRSDPAKQGGILGATESISSIARITGVVFGVRLYLERPSLPFWAAAAMMGVVFVLLMLAIPRGRDWQAERGRTKEEGRRTKD
jgi:MFS family permease